MSKSTVKPLKCPRLKADAGELSEKPQIPEVLPLFELTAANLKLHEG